MSEKVGFWRAIGNYFKDVRSELRKVVYPTAKQLVNNTIIVIVAIVLVGLFIAGLDGIFGWGRNLLFTGNLHGTQEIDWSKYEATEESEDTEPTDGLEGEGIDMDNVQEIFVDEDDNVNFVDNPEVSPEDEGSPE